MGQRDEAIGGYRKAIALFEDAGAATKAAGTGITLALDHGWHAEDAATHRFVDRAIERLGSAEPQLQMSLLTMRTNRWECLSMQAGPAQSWRFCETAIG